jgi:site-specific DNA-methyltransferase (adenine-specific)
MRRKPGKSKPVGTAGPAVRYAEQPERINPVDGIVLEDSGGVGVSPAAVPKIQSTTATGTVAPPLQPIYRDDAHGIWLYQGNCLTILDAIAAKNPDGCFDMVFADPPYFLSNGGITCHAGKMVSVHKGDWDSLAKSFGASKSKAMELMHEFNTEWLRRCQRVLKPNGTIWVTGTHHVIFSVGFAMQQLGMKILNDIAWEKPNPPPNLSCRYFTHSTETVLWAAKSEKSRHVFNYAAMKAVTGKQMKTVWRKKEFEETTKTPRHKEDLGDFVPSWLNPVWTLPAPGKAEKEYGKHPTQKPVALVERCLLAATNAGDMVLDPFMGAGTTAVACIRTYRRFVGIELDYRHLQLAGKRTDREIIEIWLREFRVRVDVSLVCHPERSEGSLSLPGLLPARNDPNDLDPECRSMDRIDEMADVPENVQAERIFHETKFVFLSCAQARTGSVVHTTVDADVQSAWTHTSQSVKLHTTRIVRCETEILRVRNS